MAEASLTVSSKNYSSWSLRGFLLCRMAGLDFTEKVAPIDDPATRAELLLLSPSFLVPCLEHGPVKVWDTLAIAEYLNEAFPKAAMLPGDRIARARCRAISAPGTGSPSWVGGWHSRSRARRDFMTPRRSCGGSRSRSGTPRWSA